MANTAKQTPSAPVCTLVTSKIELDAALANGACIHVRGDAEQSVMDWDAERQAAAAETYQAGTDAQAGH